MEHQAGEGEEGEAGHGFGQPHVVARQVAEAGDPGEGALHHPPPRQQVERSPAKRGTSDDTLAAIELMFYRWA